MKMQTLYTGQHWFRPYQLTKRLQCYSLQGVLLALNPWSQRHLHTSCSFRSCGQKPAGVPPHASAVPVPSSLGSMTPEGDAQVIASDFLSLAPLHGCKVYLIILNYTLPKATSKLWPLATFRVCADGGSNRLYDELPLMELGRDAHELRCSHIPDLIKGDLDSVRPDVSAFYQSNGVAMCDLSDDQDSTDLTKCILHIEKKFIEPARNPDQHLILVLGALGGRLDHTLSNLNTLYAYPHLNITLWGDGNLVRLVRKGRCVIRPDKRYEGPTCGLLPLGAPAVASTSGLKWDLKDTQMQISGLVSTSNMIEGSEVVVETDRELLWITEVQEPEPATTSGQRDTTGKTEPMSCG